MYGPRRAVSDAIRFRERLADAGLIHVDASVLALHLTAHPSYVALTRSLLSGLRDGAFEGRTSAVSLFQLLAEPYRRGDEEAAEKVQACLAALPGLEIVPVTAAIAGQAAQVRAQIGGSFERAVQIATALGADAELLVMQRSTLRRIAGMAVEQLDAYVPGSTPSVEG
jgi:hypothetical protein